jgi:hypothetical protein
LIIMNRVDWIKFIDLVQSYLFPIGQIDTVVDIDVSMTKIFD